jgi:hypothetical protein
MGKKHVAWSVSAGAYCYQMGIAYHIQKHFDVSDVLFSGASGGSWPALLLTTGVDVAYAFDVMMSVSVPMYENRLFGAYGSYDQGVRKAFYHIYKDIDLPPLVNGRLAIPVTRIEFFPVIRVVHEVVSHFVSNDDIIECIVASALIPFALSGKPYVIYRNWICIDGGVTNMTGVRSYHVPEQEDFDSETPIPHYDPAVTGVLADLFNRMKVSLSVAPRELISRAASQFSYPAPTQPFGLYGHALVIARTLLSELRHEWVDLTTDFPAVMNAKMQRLVRLLNSIMSKNREMQLRLNQNARLLRDELLTWEEAARSRGTGALRRSGATASPRASSSMNKPHDSSLAALSWDAINAVQRIVLSALGRHVGSMASADSWWTRNFNQVESFKAKLAVEKEDLERAALRRKSTWADCSVGRPVYVSTRRPSEVVELVDVTDSLMNKEEEQPVPKSTPELPVVQRRCFSENTDIDGALDSDISASSCEDQSTEVSLDVESATHQNAPSSSRHRRKSHMRVYWRTKAQNVCTTPCGGTQLLITPWMWRKVPLWAYHLTSKAAGARQLFEMGLVDAAEHHADLVVFFASSHS